MIPLDPSPEPEPVMQGTVSSRETAKECVAPTVGADGSAPEVGVLVCLVYRNGTRVAYIDHWGSHDALELDDQCGFGGDWEEANVIHEDGPPMPPLTNGLWRMEYPWRALTEADYTDPDDPQPREWCCIYTAPATWTLVYHANVAA